MGPRGKLRSLEEGRRFSKTLNRYFFSQANVSSSSSSIQFWSGFIPVNEGGRIYTTLPAISPTPTLHLARFFASSFFKPTLLLSFSTCDLHVFLGHPRFPLPSTSNSNTFLKKNTRHPSSWPTHPVSSHSIHLDCRKTILYGKEI